MPEIIKWEVPIKTDIRHLELMDFRMRLLHPMEIYLSVNNIQHWKLIFYGYVGYIITLVTHMPIGPCMPASIGFYEILDSKWMFELHDGSPNKPGNCRHFVICCNDKIIEVIGRDYAFELLTVNSDRISKT